MISITRISAWYGQLWQVTLGQWYLPSWNGSQMRYSATHLMLLEASYKQIDSLRGVYDVGAASTPDSDTYI